MAAAAMSLSASASAAFRGGASSARRSKTTSLRSRPRARAVVVSPRAAATPAEKSNIVVIGGTGATGAECVVQALARGAKVTVLARTPSKMAQPPGSAGEANAGKPIADPNLTVIRGSVVNPADVAKCITKDTTGVIVSLGGKTKDVGPTMLTDGTRNVIEARCVSPAAPRFQHTRDRSLPPQGLLHLTDELRSSFTRITRRR
jgi:cation diffusion facilitator CzcD-associated flavoprotein CzcO